MKTSLDHLPEAKRRELARAVEILFAEFEAVTAGGHSEHKRDAQILKVILFGSYARGDWFCVCTWLSMLCWAMLAEVAA